MLRSALLSAFMLSAFVSGNVFAQSQAIPVTPVRVSPAMSTPGSQWQGCEVGFLGDSMSTLCDTTANKRFYDYLHNLLGLTPHVYARSGWQWKNLLGEVDKLKRDHPDVDAVMVWAGTNHYNPTCPICRFFT